MKTITRAVLTLCLPLVLTLSTVAQDKSSLPYDQKIDVVYGEVHGTGLLMDVFTPKEKANGLAIGTWPVAPGIPTEAKFVITHLPSCSKSSVPTAIPYLRFVRDRARATQDWKWQIM